MRAWIIPIIALLIVGIGGVGAGWAINEWQGDEISVAEVVATPKPKPTPERPSQAEIDAELCAAALEAAAQIRSGPGSIINGVRLPPGIPPYIQNAINRCCN